MPIAKILLTLALAGVAAGTVSAFELANPSFEMARQDGQPVGWTPYAWNNPAAVPSSTIVSDGADGRHCARVQTIATGALGLVSSGFAINSEPGDMRVRLRLRPSADYAGNQPWVFLSCQKGTTFAGIVTVPLPELKPGAWNNIDVLIPAAQLIAGTDMLHLNLASRRSDGATEKISGSIDFDDVSVTEEFAAPSVTLTCDRFAQWTVLGQAATFRVSKGRLPAHTSAVTATVIDSAGATVLATTVDGTDFTAHGWAWTPTLPGFYDVTFTAQTERGGQPLAVPLTAAYNLRTPQHHDLTFTRDRWSLAVAAAPTRAMTERPTQFGFSYELTDETDIRLGDLLGLSFARIQAIAWGSQFGNVSQAIEPERGVYHWDELDRKVGWLHDRGFFMIGNVLYTPRWASPHPEDTKIYICVPGFAAWAPKDMGDWTRFLTAVVGRYGDRITTWELWNEPHLPGGSCFWQDTPENFVALLKAGYLAIKAVQPQSDIWIGGIANRYVPFYRQFAKLGGLPYFDHLAMHGSDCDPTPFRAIDKLTGVPSKPWVTSEQHGILVSPNSALPSESALAKRLVLDSFSQLARGSERLALFMMSESWEKEALEPARAEGWFIHSSGVFRTHPRLEPRFSALVWHTVVSQTNKGMQVRAQHRMNDVRILACDNVGSDLLLVWHDAATPLPVPEALATLAAKGSVIDWEGRPQSTPWTALAPGVMYLVRNADAAAVAALPLGEALPSARQARGVSGPLPTASAYWGALPETPELIPATSYQLGATAADVAAGFAVAADATGVTVQVDVRDPDLHADSEPGMYWRGDSVQLGIDTGGAGIIGDQAQFIVALTKDGPVVWKDAAPYIGGDLPSGWTSSGRPAGFANATITPIDGGLRYRIHIATSELYPLVPDRTQPLHFSLLVNSNRGQGRAGWVEWSSGIGNERNPADYGILNWR